MKLQAQATVPISDSLCIPLLDLMVLSHGISAHSVLATTFEILFRTGQESLIQNT